MQGILTTIDRIKLDIVRMVDYPASFVATTNRPEFAGSTILNVNDAVNLVDRFISYQLRRFNLPEKVLEEPITDIDGDTNLRSASFHYQVVKQEGLTYFSISFIFRFQEATSKETLVIIARRVE